MKYKFIYIVSLVFFLCQFAKGKVTDSLPERKIPSGHSLDDIIDKTIETAPIYKNLIEEYTANLYTKGYINIKKSNILINYIPSMFKLKKGIKEYITESYSELHYTAPDIFDRKIIAYHGTIDKPKGFNNEVLDNFDINIYDNSVFNVKLMSPISQNAKKYYDYKIDSTYYDENGKYLYHISFTPKYNSYQLFEGYMIIYDDTWKIHEFKFKGRSEYLNYTNKVQMGKNDSLPEGCLPVRFDSDMSFHLLGNVFEGHFTIDMDYKTVKLSENDIINENDKSKYDLTQSFTLRNDTSAYILADSCYFAKLRPFPLTEKEESLYQKYYVEKGNISIENKGQNKKSIFWGDVGDLLVGSYSINSPQIGKMRFSPLLNPFLLSYSDKDGISYKQRIRYQRMFSKNKLLNITPMVGYNFEYNEFYWRMPVKFEYFPEKMATFNLNIGNGNRIYSSEIIDELKEIPDSIFDFDKIHLDYFRDFYVDFFHSIEIFNGLSVDAGFSMHHRSAIKKSDFDKPDDLPVEVRSEYDDIFRNKYVSFAPRIKVSWTPMQYYYKAEKRKINLYSKWPTFSFDYERGIKGVFKNSSQFERLEIDMQHTVPFGHLRTLYYRAGAGVFTNKEDMFFVDFRNFEKNNLPSGWNDDIGGTFQILDRRWYNSSREYLRANLTYEAPFLLIPYIFKRVPYILNERLYLGILTMPHLNPYIEIGYGIGTHIFDFGAFVSNKNGKVHDFGVKLTIELFNR